MLGLLTEEVQLGFLEFGAGFRFCEVFFIWGFRVWGTLVVFLEWGIL